MLASALMLRSSRTGKNKLLKSGRYHLQRRLRLKAREWLTRKILEKTKFAQKSDRLETPTLRQKTFLLNNKSKNRLKKSNLSQKCKNKIIVAWLYWINWSTQNSWTCVTVNQWHKIRIPKFKFKMKWY